MHKSTVLALFAVAILSLIAFACGIVWINAAMWNHQAHGGIALQLCGAAGVLFAALAAHDEWVRVRARR